MVRVVFFYLCTLGLTAAMRVGCACLCVCVLLARCVETQKPLAPRVVHDAMSEFRTTVLFDAERRVANHIMRKFGSVGKALKSFDRNHNGLVREREEDD